MTVSPSGRSVRACTCQVQFLSALWRTKEVNQRGWMREINILDDNLTYIPKQTQRISLLTRWRTHNYWTTIGSWNRIRNHNENMNRYTQSDKWVYGNKNRATWPLTASEIFHQIYYRRDKESTIKPYKTLEKLESYNRWLKNKTRTQVITKTNCRITNWDWNWVLAHGNKAWKRNSHGKPNILGGKDSACSCLLVGTENRNTDSILGAVWTKAGHYRPRKTHRQRTLRATKARATWRTGGMS
jgi:hypothetical protein